VFFRWRTARFGAEQYWHGLLDHDGHPGRRYQEIKRMGAEMQKVGGQIHGSAIRAQAAMMLSYDSRFAFQIQANNPQFDYPEHFHQVYRGFYRYNVPMDIAAPTGDLSAYRLVIAPALHVVPEAVAENLERFVRGGGVLVLTQRSGVKDEANAVVDQRLPGRLAEMCGVEVEEYDSLAAGMSNELEFVLPGLAGAARPVAGVLCEVLNPNGALVVARYTRDYYAGQPAITLNRFGQGYAVYVGTVGDQSLYEVLAGWLLNLAGVGRLATSPEGVEVAERVQGDRRLLFVLNHTEHLQTVALDGRYTSLLDGVGPVEGAVSIQPREVLLLAQAR
jgi:beta-galactosidase